MRLAESEISLDGGGEVDDLVSLARSAASGDRGATARLIERVRPAIVRVATAVTACPHEGEDVAQETCLKLLDAIGRYDGTTPPRAWSLAIAVNAARDRVRRRATARRAVEGLAARRPPEARSAPSPEREAIAREEAARVLAALATLPDAQRAAFALCAIEAMRPTEAALVLGCRAAAVRVNLFHARTRLRDRLGAGE